MQQDPDIDRANHQATGPLFEELFRRTHNQNLATTPTNENDESVLPRPQIQTALRRELFLKVQSIRMNRNAQNDGLAQQDFQRLQSRRNDQVVVQRTFAQRCGILESKLRYSLSDNENYINMNSSSLYNALVALEWNTALKLVQRNPELAQYIDIESGSTSLHMACGRGSTPLMVIQALVNAFPQAVTIRTHYRKYYDTPLHIQARNSQATISKLQALLPHANVKMTNRQGHTALHTACGNNAMIDALRVLIASDETLLDVRDLNGRTPLGVLWEGYMQSIPGHLKIARILMGDVFELSASFSRFWAKVELLVSRGKKLEPFQLCHAMIKSDATAPMFEVALRLEPELARHSDTNGNFLIHQLIAYRYEFKRTLFDLTVTKESMIACNNDGETVLSLAIKQGKTAYIPHITEAAPSLVTSIDVETQLYPFQLAASYGCSTEVVYSLFLESPDVIEY